MLNFRMTVVNADKLDFALKGLRGELSDYTKVWPQVSKAIEAEEAWLFESRGAGGAHGPWPELTERYLAQKHRKYGPQPIEVATGLLRRSLTSAQGGGAVREYQPLSMRFGTSLPYAVYQQTGWEPSHLGRHGRIGMVVDVMLGRKKPREKFATGERVPARRVIDPGESMGDAILQAMLKAIDTMARRYGFSVAKAAGLNLKPGAARTFGLQMLAGDTGGLGAS